MPAVLYLLVTRPAAPSLPPPSQRSGRVHVHVVVTIAATLAWHSPSRLASYSAGQSYRAATSAAAACSGCRQNCCSNIHG